MKAELHPEYDLEKNYFAQTLQALQTEIERVGSSSPNAAYMNAKLALHDKAVKRYRSLQIAFESPYVGRIDVQSLGYRSKPNAARQEKFSLVENPLIGHDDDLTEDIVAHYIGEVEFEDKAHGVRVIGWETPLANLFYEAIEGEAAYETQTRSYRVATFLKRNFLIKQGSLAKITDDFDARPQKPATVTAQRTQAILESLADRRAGYLDKITGTIDREQNRLIRADRNQVLLIQGVAGSGKSIIAQYRLAYLYKTSQGQLRPEECLIFGPNRLFLDYAARVLPSLQVENILQTTFADWACTQMGLTGYKLEDAALNAVLTETKASDRERQRKASQLKNSARMGTLLKNYVAYRKATVALPPTGISCKTESLGALTLSISGTDVKEAFAAAATESWIEQRERFVELIQRKLIGQVEPTIRRIAEVWRKEGQELLEKARAVERGIPQLEIFADEARQQYDVDLEEQKTAETLDKGAKALSQLAKYYKRRGELKALQANRLVEEAGEEKRRRNLNTELSKLVEAKVAEFWKSTSTPEEYRALLANKNLLAEINQDVFTTSELAALSALPLPKGKILEVSDVAALLRLHILLNGFAAKYKHIIIDEAQDLSPLQFEHIRQASPNGSLTILGDIAQSIYEARGVSSWNEVRKIFAAYQVNYTEIVQSYRTTFEIMTAANALLAPLAETLQLTLAKPFERHDQPPQAQLLTSPEAQGEAMAQLLNKFKADGLENVAVILKTADECRVLSKHLHEAEFVDFRVALNGDFEYKEGVVLIPIHLAKGLEFEAVIVANADTAHYSNAEGDTRLLYVAATRALHELHFLGVGEWALPVKRALGLDT